MSASDAGLRLLMMNVFSGSARLTGNVHQTAATPIALWRAEFVSIGGDLDRLGA